jgi:hypothetical protein
MWLYVSSFRLCVCLGVCVCVCVCVSVSGTYLQRGTHTHKRNELTYSHITTLFITNVNQHSNSVT